MSLLSILSSYPPDPVHPKFLSAANVVLQDLVGSVIQLILVVTLVVTLNAHPANLQMSLPLNVLPPMQTNNG